MLKCLVRYMQAKINKTILKISLQTMYFSALLIFKKYWRTPSLKILEYLATSSQHLATNYFPPGMISPERPMGGGIQVPRKTEGIVIDNTESSLELKAMTCSDSDSSA